LERENHLLTSEKKDIAVTTRNGDKCEKSGESAGKGNLTRETQLNTFNTEHNKNPAHGAQGPKDTRKSKIVRGPDAPTS